MDPTQTNTGTALPPSAAPLPPPAAPLPSSAAAGPARPHVPGQALPPETSPAPPLAAPGGPPVRGHVRRAGGAPVQGATVTLIDRNGNQVGRGQSEPDGSFLLRTPGAASYTLVAAATAHRPQAVTVLVGSRPADVDLLLTGTSSLTGTVRAASDGTPVPGATASLADESGEIVAVGRTGQTGRFLLAGLTAGSYTLAVSAPPTSASAPHCAPAAVPVTIAEGGQTTRDMELASGGRLEGAVRTPAGRPVPDAQITVIDAAGNVTAAATTGPDGKYLLDNLPAGEYTLVASGYPPVATSLRLAPGRRETHDVRLAHPRD
jgi:hypothetical protein